MVMQKMRVGGGTPWWLMKVITPSPLTASKNPSKDQVPNLDFPGLPRPPSEQLSDWNIASEAGLVVGVGG